MSSNHPHEESQSASDLEPAGTDAQSAAIDQAIASEGEAVEKLEAELQEARDQSLRLQAELENFRKRLYRDMEQQLKFASLPLASDLLEIVDNLHRAIQSSEGSSDGQSLLLGVRMVYQQFLNVLTKHHCQPIASLGEAFDPNLHQAISQAPSADIPAGHVSLEAATGYRMHDRVIRPSQVIVSTGPAAGAGSTDSNQA